MSVCSCEKNIIRDYVCTVADSERITDRMVWLTLKCPGLAALVRPGNCVMVFPAAGLDPLLGRPLAVADADPEKGEISVCYMLCGRGTEMMSAFLRGASVRVRGLFGVALERGADIRLHIAAGGVGIAIFLLLNKLSKEGISGIYLGIPGRGYERYAEKISSIAPNVKIFTDDGSFGEGDSMFKVLPRELGSDEEVWSCGPSGFLDALERHYARQRGKLYFSLDNRMACGYGGCMGCVIETKDGPKRCCVDRSLFRADEVLRNGH